MSLLKKVIESDLDPFAYPWTPPKTHGLMTPTPADDDDPYAYHPMTVSKGRRLGKARVLTDEGSTKALSSFLSLHSQAPMRDRYVVVAVGSNASPEVMANKFRRRGVNTSLYLPFVRCRITNLDVGFYPSIAPRGYVAATPFHAAGHEIELWASWFDADQMAALDSTEPGYQALRLSSADYPMVVDVEGGGGEPIDNYYMYQATSGIIEIGGEPLTLRSQGELYEALATVPELASTFNRPPEEVLAWLRTPENQPTFVQMLHDAGLVGSRPLIGVDETDAAVRRTYLDSPGFPAPTTPNAMQVMPTRNGIEREGEFCMMVHPSRAAGFGTHAVATPAPNLAEGRPGVLGRLLTSPDVPVDRIEMDQMLRDGLGVDLQEWVTIAPAKINARPLADRLVGRRYASLRVQVAEHSNAETDLALMDPVIMTYLGLSNGDQVVFEGMPDHRGFVAEIRMRVAAIPDAVAQVRQNLSGGGLDARYASAESALGVYPDLGLVLMDAATRSQLNLGSHKLAVVRARPSRSHKVLTEMRESMLVLALAMLGLVTISGSTAIAIISAVVISALTILIGVLRVRAAVGLVKRGDPVPGQAPNAPRTTIAR